MICLQFIGDGHFDFRLSLLLSEHLANSSSMALCLLLRLACFFSLVTISLIVDWLIYWVWPGITVVILCVPLLVDGVRLFVMDAVFVIRWF